MSDRNSNHLLPVYPRLDLDLISATRSTLRTKDGRQILDLYGGHAVMALGYAHPELTRAIAESYSQLGFFSNSVRMGVQERAARAVLGQSEHLAFSHFVNSGAEANESAIHLARRFTGRSKILSFDCSFHGRTLGCLQANGLQGYRRRLPFAEDSSRYDFIPFDDVSALDQVDESVAAVLCESVPSLAGVMMPTEGYYLALEARCRDVGALMVFDEVQGGVGRLGRWFAHELFGVRPDIVTLAKSLGGGYPVGAMLCTRLLGEWVQPGELGTTFGGGPVACRMVETVCKLVQDGKLDARAAEIFQWVQAALEAKGLGSEGQVEQRGAGCLMGIQTAVGARELQRGLLRHDILVGTSAQSNTIRLLPSYLLQRADAERFAEALHRVLEES